MRHARATARTTSASHHASCPASVGLSRRESTPDNRRQPAGHECRAKIRRRSAAPGHRHRRLTATAGARPCSAAPERPSGCPPRRFTRSRTSSWPPSDSSPRRSPAATATRDPDLSSIESLDRARIQWDEAIRVYETMLAGFAENAEVHVAPGHRLPRSPSDRRCPAGARRSRAASIHAARMSTASRRWRMDSATGLRTPRRSLLKASTLDDGNPITLYGLAQQLIKSGRREQASGRAPDVSGVCNRSDRASRLGRAVRRPPSSVSACFDKRPAWRRSFRSDRIDRASRCCWRGTTRRRSPNSDAPPPPTRCRRFAWRSDRGRDRRRRPQARAAAAGAQRRSRPPWTRRRIGPKPIGSRRRVLGRRAVRQERRAVDCRDSSGATTTSDRGWRSRTSSWKRDAPPKRNNRSRRRSRSIPDSGSAHYRLGQLYQTLSLLPQAVQEFETAATLTPLVGLDRLYETIGGLYVNQADFDRAVDAYAKRVDVNPNNADAHRKLGEIYFLQGRDDEALAEFVAALLIDPRNSDALAAACQVYVRMGRYAEAVDSATTGAGARRPAQRGPLRARDVADAAWAGGRRKERARDLSARCRRRRWRARSASRS